MRKSSERFLAYLGAFGTVWTLLRDFGLDVEAALILVVFGVGVLVGLRLRVRREGVGDRQLLSQRPSTQSRPNAARALSRIGAGASERRG
jgi:hypothetical protein